MTMIHTWSEELAIGHTLIDAQHQRLFSLIDEIADDAPLESVLDALQSYVRQHFQAEERLMRERGFPALAGHQALHHGLAERFEEYYTQWLLGDMQRGDLRAFLARWLYDHVAGVDQDIRSFLAAAGHEA